MNKLIKILVTGIVLVTVGYFANSNIVKGKLAYSRLTKCEYESVDKLASDLEILSISTEEKDAKLVLWCTTKTTNKSALKIVKDKLYQN